MARPLHSTKERIPLFQDDFDRLILKVKRSKDMKSTTKLKLIRAYTILFYTGCRANEINDFDIYDLAFIKKHMKTSLNNKNKTNSTRLLKFNKVGHSAICELNTSDCKAKLFYKNNSDQSMSENSFTRLLNKYLKKFLHELYTTHSFRAGLINATYEATGNIKIAQKLAGHKDTKTTLLYVVATDTQVEDALDKIFK